MQAMPSYREYCPIAVGAEFFGDRWTPLILRELILGCRRFNDIHRGLGRMSRTLLVQRLRELERRGIVERTVDVAGRTTEYRLTPAGKELEPVVWAWRGTRPQPFPTRHAGQSMSRQKSRKRRCFFGLAHYDVHRMWIITSALQRRCGIHPHRVELWINSVHVPTSARCRLFQRRLLHERA